MLVAAVYDLVLIYLYLLRYSCGGDVYLPVIMSPSNELKIIENNWNRFNENPVQILLNFFLRFKKRSKIEKNYPLDNRLYPIFDL